MADEYIPMEFYTDDTIAVDLGEVIKPDTPAPEPDTPAPVNANYNQTDPTAPDYIIGREKIQDAINIGSAYMYGYESGKWYDAVDVTNTISYKPGFDEAWGSAFKPMSFESSSLGSGTGEAYIFHSHYCLWDWHSKSFDLYFHAYTDNGELKVVMLHYQYDEADTSTPQSITAYLVEVPTIGDIDTALDELHTYAQALINGGDA